MVRPFAPRPMSPFPFRKTSRADRLSVGAQVEAYLGVFAPPPGPLRRELLQVAGPLLPGERQPVRHCLASRYCVLPGVSLLCCLLYFRIKFKILLKAIQAPVLLGKKKCQKIPCLAEQGFLPVRAGSSIPTSYSLMCSDCCSRLRSFLH